MTYKGVFGWFRLLLGAALLSSVIWQITDRIINNLFRPWDYFTKLSIDSSIFAGIRPEKFRISLLQTPTSGNVLSGGKIEDVSYIGVSTQYQVMMPWGQELMVFEQNDDGVAPFDKGDDVNISWEPNFTFGLRGDEDIEAGTEVNPEELEEE